MSLRLVSRTSSLVARVKLPERFKGTIVEKWTNYWKNLCIDYVQMLKDIRSDIQSDPKKAFYYIGGFGTGFILYKKNPTELDFKDELIKITNEVILVGEQCRNSASTEHLLQLQRSYNEGMLRYRSLGLLSVMYRADYSQRCDAYKAHCSHVAPSYLSLPNRIVDVGVLGKWWNIFIKTSNYDVNPQELLRLRDKIGQSELS